MSSRSSYASAPVVLRKLLEVEPIRYQKAGEEERLYSLQELLDSDFSAELISGLIWTTHELRISATSIRRWREA